MLRGVRGACRGNAKSYQILMEPQMNTDKGKFFFTAEDAEVAEKE
jgi:hypothetical protein